MRNKSNTTHQPSSTKRFPQRETGHHVHGAEPAEVSSREDEIKRKVTAYPKLKLYFTPQEIYTWANKHPAATCKTDRKLLDRLAFLLTRKKDEPFCKISHNELAGQIGVTRETVSRRLTKLKERGAIDWEQQTNDYGANIKCDYSIALDKSKPRKKAGVTSPVTLPCDTPVTRFMTYARAAISTLFYLFDSTHHRSTTNQQRPNYSARQKKKTAGRKQQASSKKNEKIAVIECLDKSVYPFTESFLTDMAQHYEGIDLRSLLVELAGWYEEHPDKRASLSVLKQDWQNRFREWLARDKYKQT